MEITLEKIELVKDRTGVSYKEAKEALELSEGSVVDAIIAIEEAAAATGKSKASEYAQETVAKIKEFVNKGNISKITVKRGDDVLLNIPVTVGIVGIALAPWGALAAAIAAFGFKCDIELTQDDGKVINITEKTLDATDVIREKGAVVWEQAKDKGSVVWEQAKDKGADVWEQAKDKGADLFEQAKEKAPGAWENVKEKGEEIIDAVKEKVAKENVPAEEGGNDETEIEFDFDEVFAEENLEDIIAKELDKEE